MRRLVSWMLGASAAGFAALTLLQACSTIAGLDSLEIVEPQPPADDAYTDELAPVEEEAADEEPAVCETKVVEVAAGTSHTCAIKKDGTLWCWGASGNGRLGTGATTDQTRPGQVTALGNSVVRVVAGEGHTCARKADGTLWCWGLNASGQLGDGTTSDRVQPVQVAALQAPVVYEAAGDRFTCAVKNDGTLWCWGDNYKGQVGNGSSSESVPSPTQVDLETGISKVTAGVAHTCAIRSNGSLWCWGNNYNGQLGYSTAPSTTSAFPGELTDLGASVRRVAAGGQHTCAINEEAALWCWGWNGFGQLGLGNVADKGVATAVPDHSTDAVEIAAATQQTCLVTTDHSLLCWGDNAKGQLGIGSIAEKHAPQAVTALGKEVAKVALGQAHTCAIKTDDTLWCWGDNDNGRLGTGNLTSSTTPVNIVMSCP